MGRLRKTWFESFNQSKLQVDRKQNNDNYRKSIGFILLCRKKISMLCFLCKWNSIGWVLSIKLAIRDRHNESHTHD